MGPEGGLCSEAHSVDRASGQSAKKNVLAGVTIRVDDLDRPKVK